MICIFVILMALCHQSSCESDSCVVITNCHESPDREWRDGIFCHSVFSISGDLLMVNCSWLPYPSLSFGEYKQQLVWGNNPSYCMEIDATETSTTISKYDLQSDEINTIWVSLQFSNHECVKTNNFIIIPEVNCQAPLIQYAAQSAKLLKFGINGIGQLRYRETATDDWHMINVTDHSINIAVPETSKSYFVQQRCLNESCFHCRWTHEKLIPHKLTGAPDVTVTTKKLSPGKQSISIEWKYAMHAHVDVYNVVIQRLPDSCQSNINFKIKTTTRHVNLSIAFFNVSVTANNEAGNSFVASTLVRPISAPELPGKIFAIYEHDIIFLTWSPFFIDDFCVINWGTNYTHMKDDVLMDPIQNYSISGPFEKWKRYTITIHLHDSNMCMDSRNETAFGITYIYVEEGAPRTSPPNVTIKNVTKTSAVIEWDEIPEEDCLGFLLFYTIFYTDIVNNITQEINVNVSSKRIYQIKELASSHEYQVRISGVTIKGAGPPSAPLIFTTHYYAEGEFQIIIISTCVGLVIIAVTVVSVCAYILNRTKNWYFPKIPTPHLSHLSSINEEPATKSKSFQLLQTQEDMSCGSMDLEVIEKVLVLSTPKDLCVKEIESNMYSDYQNQWCPSAQAPLTQDETMSVLETVLQLAKEET
ncbi:interleukin-6 receptor subunit beta-like [Pyxicephalus adspersus]|uniref:interleukin-6 receptor subunit beta-like n=1 Tax=Pyxicephalus adspersus TaxID=30357 RepID=UPI003B5AE1E5